MNAGSAPERVGKVHLTDLRGGEVLEKQARPRPGSVMCSRLKSAKFHVTEIPRCNVDG